MERLKPCPFCGGDGWIQKHIFDAYIGYPDTYGVMCLDCGCKTRQSFKAEKDAIDAWNRRVDNETT